MHVMFTRLFQKIALLKRDDQLDYFLIGWHAIAAVIAIAAGMATGSIVLVGFGLVSAIDAVQSGIVLWQNHKDARGQAMEKNKTIGKRILFFVGTASFLLALYVLNEAGSKLLYREKPGTSLIGIILSVIAFVIPFVVSIFRMRTITALTSKVFRADAKETVIRSFFPVLLFFGLWLPMRFGWWWADPVAVLFMLPLIVRTGWKAVEKSKDGPSYRDQTRKIYL